LVDGRQLLLPVCLSLFVSFLCFHCWCRVCCVPFEDLRTRPELRYPRDKDCSNFLFRNQFVSSRVYILGVGAMTSLGQRPKGSPVAHSLWWSPVAHSCVEAFMSVTATSRAAPEVVTCCPLALVVEAFLSVAATPSAATEVVTCCPLALVVTCCPHVRRGPQVCGCNFTRSD
jgi:hypothetical protein